MNKTFTSPKRLTSIFSIRRKMFEMLMTKTCTNAIVQKIVFMLPTSVTRQTRLLCSLSFLFDNCSYRRTDTSNYKSTSCSLGLQIYSYPMWSLGRFITNSSHPPKGRTTYKKVNMGGKQHQFEKKNCKS